MGLKKKGVWEYPPHSGIKFLKVINRARGQTFGESIRVIVPRKITGVVRIRKNFGNLTDAERYADELITGRERQGQDFFVATTDGVRRELLALLPRIEAHGVTLTQAVEMGLKHLPLQGRSKTIAQVVEELVTLKREQLEKGDLRPRSFEDFRDRAEKIGRDFNGKVISALTEDDVKGWARKMKVAARSVKNAVFTLAEVLNFAVQKRYVSASPLQYLTKQERKSLYGASGQRKQPAILTVKQMESLLTAAREHHLLGFVTLAGFCGIRTEEIKRLQWSAVHLEDTEPFVHISPSIAKKRAVRNVVIPPNAVAWLRLMQHRQGPIVTQQATRNAHTRAFMKLAKAAGIDWKANMLRHSYGSYHSIHGGDTMKTAASMGHRQGDQVLWDFYKALVRKPDAEAYFALTPK